MQLRYLAQLVPVTVAASLLAGCHNTSGTAPQSANSTPEASHATAPQAMITHLDHVTITHLDQTPEQAYPWGAIHWLMSGRIDSDAKQTFGVVRINPGAKNALHLHPNCEELLYVLSGSGESVVADQKVPLHPGDLLRVPAQTQHQAKVTSKEPMVAVISYSSPDRQVVNYGESKE